MLFGYKGLIEHSINKYQNKALTSTLLFSIACSHSGDIYLFICLLNIFFLLDCKLHGNSYLVCFLPCCIFDSELGIWHLVGTQQMFVK